MASGRAGENCDGEEEFALSTGRGRILTLQRSQPQKNFSFDMQPQLTKKEERKHKFFKEKNEAEKKFGTAKARPQDTNPQILRAARRSNLGLIEEPPANYLPLIYGAAENFSDIPYLGKLRSFSPTMVDWAGNGEEFSALVSEEEIHMQAVVGLDFEMHADQTYDGLLCLGSLATPNKTVLFDCLQDRRQQNVKICDEIEDICGNPSLIKAVCGSSNDILRLKKQWGIHPLAFVDVQDLYLVWKNKDFTGCFERSKEALRIQAQERRKLTSSTALEQQFEDMQMPGLAFLINVFDIQDFKANVTMADWRVRPLAPELISYAAKDAYYTLAVFYELYLLVGHKGVVEAGKMCADKLTKSPKNPKYKPLFPVGYDFIASGINDWREYVAKIYDWKPEQVLPAKSGPQLAEYFRKKEYNPEDTTDITKTLEELGCKIAKSGSVKLLRAYINPDQTERKRMESIVCHNCSNSGHTEAQCPKDYDRESQRRFRYRPEHAEKQMSRNEKKLQRYVERKGGDINEHRSRLVSKWKEEKKAKSEALGIPPPPKQKEVLDEAKAIDTEDMTNDNWI